MDSKPRENEYELKMNLIVSEICYAIHINSINALNLRQRCIDRIRRYPLPQQLSILEKIVDNLKNNSFNFHGTTASIYSNNVNQADAMQKIISTLAADLLIKKAADK